MSNMKTYRDSYLYNQSDSSGTNLMKKHDMALMNFITKANRIDKRSEAFSGIVEDIKRQQTSAILYQVLMMDNVQLCEAPVELPPAFKVFEAFDLKSQDRKPTVFIDITKLIIMRGGYYTCRDIGKLISYLMGALTYLLYRLDPVKMVNNSALTIAGTECYTALYCYILDYLRIIGYSNNKDRIAYLAAMFYQVHMLGKDIDNYTKNLAVKISKVPSGMANAMDMFLEDDIFRDINTFTTFLAETFKLKGFTTEVFIQKWMYLYGNGTQYATELYTSLSVLISNAFCGAYVINQKQVERCCGQSMVAYCNALLRYAVDNLDQRRYMEAAELKAMEPIPKETLQLKEQIQLQRMNPTKLKIVAEDYSDNKTVRQKLEASVDFYTRANRIGELENVFNYAFDTGIQAMDRMVEENTKFNRDALFTVVEMAKSHRNTSTRNNMTTLLQNITEHYRDEMDIAKEQENDDRAERCGTAMLTAIQLKNMI